MNEVVLRCPNCGTTQNTAGECDACHEASVRHFCANHTPGRWLDGPACGECGATVDHGPAGAAPSSRPPTPRTPPSRAPGARERMAPTPRTRATTEPPWRPPSARGREADERDERVPASAAPSAIDILLRVARAAGAAREAAVARRVDAPPVVRRGRSLGGCFMRLALVVGILILLAMAALWFFAGGAVQTWAVDVGQSTGVMSGVPAQTERGIDSYRRGDRVLAERELDEAARTYRRSGLALLYLARIREEAGDAANAGAYLEEAARREPENAVTQRILGEHDLTRARRQQATGAPGATTTLLLEAESHLDRASVLDTTDRRARGYRACALAALGRAEEAASVLSGAGSGPWDGCASPRTAR